MTAEDKSMFAGCIDKMSARSCGACVRRDDCSFVMPETLGALLSTMRPSNAERPAETASRLFGFLSELAKGVARGQADKTAPPKATPVRHSVERDLEARLGTGPIGADEIARALGYSRQTLYRRLKAEGATFDSVLDGLRHRLALRLIRAEGLPVKEVAWRLGFSDPAAFSRAFKRWTGVSPRDLKGRTPH